MLGLKQGVRIRDGKSDRQAFCNNIYRGSGLKDEIRGAVVQIAETLVSREWMLVTAESCTGGGVAQALTSLAGSSAWFERGFVTYSNRSKEEMLGIDAGLIKRHGAVSLAVVEAMALGALDNSAGQVSLAISGIAGPAGGSETKPVGTVCFSWVIDRVRFSSDLVVFDGDRESVRAQAVAYSLSGLELMLKADRDAFKN
ncbi:MAG TPA: CinA family protein [Chromatiales bacterium]|nr:CinA family protein [Chromatiales bacterium]